MPLPRVTFTFDGAAADQSRAIRSLPLGAFAELRNTRQIKRGSLRKRRAFHRQSVTLTNLTGETITNGTAFDSLGWANGAVYRDNRDNFWALDSARTAAHFRGTIPRLGVGLRAFGHTNNKTHKAACVLAGTDLYAISLGDNGVNFSLDQQYRKMTISCFDAATGVRKSGPTDFGAQARNYSAVYDGSRYVWILAVNNDQFVKSYRIDTQVPSAAPIQATYYDGGADFVANCVDTVKIGANIYVVVTSYNSTATKGLITRHSILAQGTGLETAGAVESVPLYVPANQGLTCQINNGCSFLEAQPGGTNGYYAFWTVGSADEKAALKLVQFNLTTLALTSIGTVGTEFNAALLGTAHAGLVTGYYDPADGHVILFAHIFRQIDSTATARLVRYDHVPAGATASTSTLGYGSTLASKPFKDTASSGRWYILTQYDDTEDRNLQRAWHVRIADRAGPLIKNIVAQEAWGRGSAAFHMWRSDLTGFVTSFVTQTTPFAASVPLLSGKFYAGVELADTAYKTVPQVMILDTAAAYSPPARLSGNLLCYPGGVPQVVGPADSARDLAVLMGPSIAPTNTAGAGAALLPCLVTYSYRTRTADGRITRSPLFPEPASLTWNDGGTGTLLLQPLWHIGRDGNGAEVEVWASLPGGTDLFLQMVSPNVADANILGYLVDPAKWTDLGEPLPVGLVATPAPPTRVVATFKDRLFLTGTDLDGEVWYSQPLEEGVGVELNAEGLRQVTRGGPINAAAAIDWNTFALFHRDAVTCLQGNGPDGNGGAYETVDLHTQHGVEHSNTTGHLVVPTSRGIFYQSADDARIQLLSPALQVVEASQGIETVVLSGATPAPVLTAGLEVVNDGATWLQFADGTTCALDHRNPTQAAPLGDVGAWHTWTSAALAAADAYSVGLIDAGGTPLWLSSAGQVRRPKIAASDANPWQDDTGSSPADVLMRWKTGKVAPAGQQVEMYVSEVTILGTHVGASSARLQITNDADVAENHDVTTSSPLNLTARPANCLRTQELEVSFEELASATEGPVCDAFSVEFRPAGGKRLATGRIF